MYIRNIIYTYICIYKHDLYMLYIYIYNYILSNISYNENDKARKMNNFYTK